MPRRVVCLIVILLLWVFPARAGESIDDLLEDLVDPDPRTRLGAANALRAEAVTGKEKRALVLALARALDDRDQRVRAAAAWALSWQTERGLDEPPRQLVARLVRGLKAPQERVRACCAAALSNLGSRGLTALLDLLSGKDTFLQVAAAREIHKLALQGKVERKAIPPLVKALGARDKEVRVWAATALTYLVEAGKATQALRQALLKGLRDPEKRFADTCANCLVALRSAALTEVLELLDGKDKKLRARAAGILRSMTAQGYRPSRAIPALRRASKAGDKDIRDPATQALRWIEGKP